MSELELAVAIAEMHAELKNIAKEVTGLRDWRHETAKVVQAHEGQIFTNTKRLDKLIDEHNDRKLICNQTNTVAETVVERPVSNLQATLKFLSSMGGAGIIILGLAIIALLVAKSMGLTFKV